MGFYGFALNDFKGPFFSHKCPFLSWYHTLPSGWNHWSQLQANQLKWNCWNQRYSLHITPRHQFPALTFCPYNSSSSYHFLTSGSHRTRCFHRGGWSMLWSGIHQNILSPWDTEAHVLHLWQRQSCGWSWFPFQGIPDSEGLGHPSNHALSTHQ